MAKWGEGDSRWIVEERADGTNANNWHWTEKKATAWSNRTLKELLVDLAFEDAGHEARITELTSCDGDCIANCRKGKLIFFYELVLKLKWSGTAKDGSVANGTLTIPNLSEENDDMDDIEVNVSMDSDETAETRRVKDLVRKKGASMIRLQLGKWLKALKEEYAADLIKPTNQVTPQKSGGADGGAAAAASKPAPAAAPAQRAAAPAKSPASKDTKYKTITLTDEFKCRPDELFRAMVTEDQIRAYTQSECKVDPKVGGEFSMFGGNVVGVFKEIVPGKKIVQAWRFKHWTASHFSEVSLEISDLGDKCKLQLTQTGIPESDVESTKAGWRSHQWDRMKGILGFGSGISFGL